MSNTGDGLSRREFIKKSAGMIGLTTIMSFSLVMALRRFKVTSNNAQIGSGEEKENVSQWCMVIDLKKCDGCIGLGLSPQCLQVCIIGHFVPKNQKWIEIYKAELPGGGSYFMPTPCFHCENAPCVNVCPVAATYHTKNGLVLIDQRRCIGCRMCMAACPYQRRFFNWGNPELPPEAFTHEYSPEHQVPAMRGTVMKCDFCPGLLQSGRLPYCVSACPRKVLYMGDLNKDIATNGVELVKLSKFLDENNAYRYKEELGTQPRVWYLPGHGQEFNRNPEDLLELIPIEWPWGGEGYSRQLDIWPWGDD